MKRRRSLAVDLFLAGNRIHPSAPDGPRCDVVLAPSWQRRRAFIEVVIVLIAFLGEGFAHLLHLQQKLFDAAQQHLDGNGSEDQAHQTLYCLHGTLAQ